MMQKSLGAPSFNCPHCGAVSQQDWHRLAALRCDQEDAPFIPGANFEKTVEDQHWPLDQKLKSLDWAKKMRYGHIFIDDWRSLESGTPNRWQPLGNLSLCLCFSCQNFSVWLHDRLIHPPYAAIRPNDDLPEDVKRDFVEAANIVDVSPRGSAALLRLCVQKLCRHLGKSGHNINQDIADLVRDGLDARLQKALDVVRVVGNNAVHPGQIDLTDDRDTASQLFVLVNLIADALITQPRHINELYQKLPQSARTQILSRDQPS